MIIIYILNKVKKKMFGDGYVANLHIILLILINNLYEKKTFLNLKKVFQM